MPRKPTEYKTPLRREIERKVKQTPAPCMWFLRCPNPATGTTPHPAFPGGVDTCDKCHHFATGETR